MAKVLQRLVRTGLLVSTQGTRGGYTLAGRRPLISVADVIQAIDGPLTVTACSTEKNDCEQYASAASAIRCGRSGSASWRRSTRCTIAEMAADPTARRRPPCARRRAPAHAGAAIGGETDDDEAADLHGLPRHDAGGSAGARGDAAVLHRAVRQRREPQPRLRLGGRGGGGGRAQAGGRPDRREPEGDRLHERRHRVEQPGDQGRREMYREKGNHIITA
jgi:DNA-binding IscR family transcriptional regulator